MGKQQPNSLKGYYLTRLCNAGTNPFDSVTDLAREAAAVFCAKNAPNRHVDVKNEPGENDQFAYIDVRLKGEQWLREQAIAAGVTPQRENCVYFCLSRDPGVQPESPRMQRISIPAESIDLSTCSFTYHDSFAHFPSERDKAPDFPLRGKVMNQHDVAKLLETEDLPGIYGDFTNKNPVYIEVQMWARPKGPVPNVAAPRPALKNTPKPAQ